jgi:hypothetical protein
MYTNLQHRSTLELEQGLADVLASPKESGRLESIFIRPAKNERRQLMWAVLTPGSGMDGDRWAKDSFYKVNGKSDPRCEVSLMNTRFLRLVAGDEDALCLAGDNLIVDLDLSESNLPAGTRLAVGKDVVLEISDRVHTGCSKFQSRYGKEARDFANSQQGKSLHLRGRYARIIKGGKINVGDAVTKPTVP